jgi:hypothetical protein
MRHQTWGASISVWVAMFWTCFVRGLHLGGACCRDAYSVDGFRPSRLCSVVRLNGFCPDEFPASCFECLTETAGYPQGVDGLSATRAEIRLVTPAASSRGGAGANAAMPVSPATAPSSGISPVRSSGTVPNLLAANSRNTQYLTQRPVQRDYAFHLLLGLGFRDVVSRWRLRDGMHAAFGIRRVR